MLAGYSSLKLQLQEDANNGVRRTCELEVINLSDQFPGLASQRRLLTLNDALQARGHPQFQDTSLDASSVCDIGGYKRLMYALQLYDP